MASESLTIGEVAAQAGVNVQTLRYYERRGLLKEPRRNYPSGHRQYPSDAVAFIRSIKQAQSLGFTLDEIDEFVRLAERRPAKAGEALAASATRKLAEIDDKVAALRTMRLGLETLIEQRCDSLTSCSCGKGCPVGPSVETRVALLAEAAASSGATSNKARGVGMMAAAATACLACFLPAIVGGGLAVGAVGSLSVVDAPFDLVLVAGGAAIGAAAVGGAFAFRRRGGAAC